MRDFCREKDIRPRDSRDLYRFADRAFGAICAGGIDVAIASFESRDDRVGRKAARHLRCAVA